MIYCSMTTFYQQHRLTLLLQLFLTFSIKILLLLGLVPLMLILVVFHEHAGATFVNFKACTGDEIYNNFHWFPVKSIKSY